MLHSILLSLESFFASPAPSVPDGCRCDDDRNLTRKAEIGSALEVIRYAVSLARLLNRLGAWLLSSFKWSHKQNCAVIQCACEAANTFLSSAA